jgi:hypothetical protein
VARMSNARAVADATHISTAVLTRKWKLRMFLDEYMRNYLKAMNIFLS